MASTNDLSGLNLPGPFRRDDPLGYETINKIVDDVGTLSNVVQYELDSQGIANSRKFLRANALFTLDGGGLVFNVTKQSTENLFDATATIVSAGVVDITFTDTISDADYEVFLTPAISGTTASFMATTSNGGLKTTGGFRVYSWTWNGSAIVATTIDSFAVGLAYGV